MTAAAGLLPGNLFTVADSDFETALTGNWAATTNCTLAQSATHAFTGGNSLRISTTAAGASVVTYAGLPVAAGQGHDFSWYAFATAAGRTAQASLVFRTGGGTQVGATITQALYPLASGAWIPAADWFVPPATAVKVDIAITIATPGTAELTYLDLFYCAPALARVLVAWGTSPLSLAPQFADMTPFTRADKTISYTRGRGDEISAVQPGSASFTLDNGQWPGWFAQGSAGSPFAPTISRRARLSFADEAGAFHTRFDGTITDLVPGWDDGTGLSSLTAVSVQGLLAWLSRGTAMRTMVEEEILLDGPLCLYTLADQPPATTAGDSSGNAAPPLQVHAYGTGGTLTFGTGAGIIGALAPGYTSSPLPSLSAHTASPAGNSQLEAYLPSPVSATAGFSFGVWCNLGTNASALPITIVNSRTGAFIAVDVTTAGVHPVQLVYAPSPSALVTGSTAVVAIPAGIQHFMITVSGTTATLYVNGAAAATLAVPASFTADYLIVSGSPGGLSVNAAVGSPGGVLGSLNCAAVFGSALPASRINAQWTAGSGQNWGQLIAALAGNVLAYAGIPQAFTNLPGTAAGVGAFLKLADFTGSYLTGQNANFDGGIGTWLGTGNCSVAGIGSPTQAGSGALQMTCTTAGNIACSNCAAANIGTQGLAVTAGDWVPVSIWFRATATPRTCQAGADFYDGTNTFNSTLFGADTIVSSIGGWTFLATHVKAPVTGHARMKVQIQGAVLNETHDIDTAAFGGPATLAQAIAQWTAASGRSLDVRREYYAASFFPGSITADLLADQAAGREVRLTLRPAYAPVSATDLANMATFLASCKAAGLRMKVTLWHEPFYSGLSAAQYIAMVQYYGPTVRQYYPLVFVTANSAVLQNNENSFYPGDGQVDEIATDYYAQGYASGDRLDLAASLADNASPPKLFGLWEFNASTDATSGQTTLQGTNAFGYVKSFFDARLVARKANGDILLFNADSNTAQETPLTYPGDYRMALFQAQYDDAAAARAAIAGVPIVAPGTGVSYADAFELAGQTPLAILQAYQQADGGVFYEDSLGRIAFGDRAQRYAAQAVPALVLTPGQYEPPLAMPTTTQFLVNDATFGNGNIPAGVRAASPASVAANGTYPSGSPGSPVTAPFYSFPYTGTGEVVAGSVPDGDVLADAAAWAANIYGTPVPRSPGVTIDLATQPASEFSRATAYGVEIGKVIQLSGLPASGPGGTRASFLVVEGITEAFTRSDQGLSWALAFNTSPASQSGAWIPGDAAMGILDSTAVVGRGTDGADAGGYRYAGPPYPVPVFSASMNETGNVGANDMRGLAANVAQALYPPVAYAQQVSLAQQIANSTNADVQWDVLQFDSAGGFLLTGDVVAYHVQVPGIYDFMATVVFANNGTGDRRAWLQQNGGGAFGYAKVQAVASGQTTAVLVAATLSCAAGDKIKVTCFQTSGGTLGIGTSNGGSQFCVRFRGN